MIVLDSSAALGIAHNTADGLGIRELICRGERVVAPWLFQAEVANACFKEVRFGEGVLDEEISSGLAALSQVDEFIEMGDLMTEVISESVRLKHPAYDMFYFVLARRRHATLATLDRKLIKLCEENGVDCIHLIPFGVEE